MYIGDNPLHMRLLCYSTLNINYLYKRWSDQTFVVPYPFIYSHVLLKLLVHFLYM